jgi:hypothetical protein
MKQERHVIAAHVEIALVDVDNVGHFVEVGDRRTIGVVNDLAILATIGNAEDFVERLAVGVLDRRVVELTADDEINRLPFSQRPLGKRGDVRADKANP